MGKVILKTVPRKTSVTRAEVHKAVVTALELRGYSRSAKTGKMELPPSSTGKTKRRA